MLPLIVLIVFVVIALVLMNAEEIKEHYNLDVTGKCKTEMNDMNWSKIDPCVWNPMKSGLAYDSRFPANMVKRKPGLTYNHPKYRHYYFNDGIAPDEFYKPNKYKTLEDINKDRDYIAEPDFPRDNILDLDVMWSGSREINVDKDYVKETFGNITHYPDPSYPAYISSLPNWHPWELKRSNIVINKNKNFSDVTESQRNFLKEGKLDNYTYNAAGNTNHAAFHPTHTLGPNLKSDYVQGYKHYR